MKSKLKKFLTSFILMILVNFACYSEICGELGMGSAHVGLLYVLGLLFGPYGAFGAVMGNIIVNYIEGYPIETIIPSAVFSFGISYLAYKLWYSKYKNFKITKPKLDTIYHLALFLSSIIICGLIYATVHGNLTGIFFTTTLDEYTFIFYFLNFINSAFIFGVILIWLSDKISFIDTPTPSNRPANKRAYHILFYLLIIIALISTFSLLLIGNEIILIAATILVGTILFIYLTKPFTEKIENSNENTIIKNIVKTFLIITLFIAISGLLITSFSYSYITNISNLNHYIYIMPSLIISDIIIILFFIPGFVILKYIENKVIKPISSFSEIEGFIRENEKIETEGLVEIYSKYINENNEIGTLARSYTDLINHNNNYVENIREIEGEKERINAELDIATRIQAAFLPTKSIETDDFIVNGYSHPAKEVGGDFFDYHMLDDDNLAVVIGDVSGKGIPAAILAAVTQVMIKQILTHDQDPSEVLSSLNNQISKNNPESMFITIWLGIYNKTTKKLTYSNAGHNPPLIKENNEFRYLDLDSGIVIGIMEGFDYVQEELTLIDELVIYTDGITDANNKNYEMYGENRLLNFFNEFDCEDDPITPLLEDIHSFTKDAEQFDDMTLSYLKIK